MTFIKGLKPSTFDPEHIAMALGNLARGLWLDGGTMRVKSDGTVGMIVPGTASQVIFNNAGELDGSDDMVFDIGTGGLTIGAVAGGGLLIYGVGVGNIANLNSASASFGVAGGLSQLGDFNASGNSTLIAVNDAGPLITINSRGGACVLGDVGGSANNTQLNIDDSNRLITIGSGVVGNAVWDDSRGTFTIQTYSGSSAIVVLNADDRPIANVQDNFAYPLIQLGDVSGRYNNSLITVDDEHSRIVIAAQKAVIGDHSGNGWYVMDLGTNTYWLCQLNNGVLVTTDTGSSGLP